MEVRIFLRAFKGEFDKSSHPHWKVWQDVWAVSGETTEILQSGPNDKADYWKLIIIPEDKFRDEEKSVRCIVVTSRNHGFIDPIQISVNRYHKAHLYYFARGAIDITSKRTEKW